MWVLNSGWDFVSLKKVCHAWCPVTDNRVILKIHAQDMSHCSWSQNCFLHFPRHIDKTLLGAVVTSTIQGFDWSKVPDSDFSLACDNDLTPSVLSWSSPRQHCYEGITSHATHKQTWTWPPSQQSSWCRVSLSGINKVNTDLSMSNV